MPLYSWWEQDTTLILLLGLDGGPAPAGKSPEEASGSELLW